MVYNKDSLVFWVLSMAEDSEYYKSQRFRNWISFRLQVRGGRHLVCWGPQKELTSIAAMQ
jgi:hypothetical protein